MNYTRVIQYFSWAFAHFTVLVGSFLSDSQMNPSDWYVDPIFLGVPGLRPDGDLDWRQSALCAQTDPEAFFPEKGGSTRDAKRICEACEVRVECLEFALRNDERFGIWGGLSERERRLLKRRKSVNGSCM